MTDADIQHAGGVERVAAVAALLCLAAAAALAVIGAASNWKGLALTVAGLAVIVPGGWYAVSRRGATRSIAVVVVVAGAIAVVAGFATGDLSALRVAGVVVLAAASVASARVALGRSATALDRRAQSRSPSPPAQHPVLIMNPRSGGGKAERFHLVDECRARRIEPIVLRPGDDLVKLAEDAIARGADVIGMAGGDGSQALVAAVASRHKVPHVVVPAGTRNHFALDLGLDRDDVVAALDAFGDGVERVVDLASVNGHVFVNNASLGLYAKIVQSEAYREAKAKTAAEMLPDLLGPEAAPLDLRFTGPDGSAYPTAHIIQVSNDPYQLHSLAGFGTRERLDLGVLGIVAVRIANAREATAFFGLEAAGRPARFGGWLEWTAPRFRIDAAAPVEVGLDGEALQVDPPLRFETMPGALRVRIPRRAVGQSPAATAVDVLAGSTIAQLARTAVGH